MFIDVDEARVMFAAIEGFRIHGGTLVIRTVSGEMHEQFCGTEEKARAVMERLVEHMALSACLGEIR